MDQIDYSIFKYNPADYDVFDNYGFLGEDLRSLYNSKIESDKFPDDQNLYWKLKDNVFLVIGDLKGIKSCSCISQAFFDEMKEYVLSLLVR